MRGVKTLQILDELVKGNLKITFKSSLGTHQ